MPPGVQPPVGARPGMPPQQGAGRPNPPDGGPRDGNNGIGTALGAAAVGVAVGVVGGMMLGGEAHALDDVHRQRREVVRDGSTYYAEPGRVIIRDENGLYMRHDETERFRAFGGRSYDEERRGDDYVKVWERPDGVRIITVTDADGRLVRRIRRWPDGREDLLIDNDFRPRPRHWREEVVVLPPPPVPASRWYVDAERADEEGIWETLRAPPLAPLPRRYTLDEVRASRDLRAYMPAVDVDTITFDTGSWTVEPSQVSRLDRIARSIGKIISANPEEIFLVEGHTDAVGPDVDNLSLSDRRAQSVAAVLTQNFGIPAENLVTQGYGEQVLKEATSGPSRINRRVTVRRITPLLGNASNQ
jgi:outer membrane protein OmpA-like peptidoglycan-associated protein